MEANESPEKLYLIQHNRLICYCRNNNEDIEYTRTDAFIEKACEWLIERYESQGVILLEDINEFKQSNGGTTMKASECKCCICGNQAVAFWPIVDPDIHSFPYCRECLDKEKMKLMAKLSEIDKKQWRNNNE